MAHSIVGMSQAPEKVTVTDLFYLRGLDVGSVNIPYLLARYLRRFAAGRKSEALISGGQFEGDAGGVAEETLVVPRGGDEDEEMPQAGLKEVLDSMAATSPGSLRGISRGSLTRNITSLSQYGWTRPKRLTARYSASPVEYIEAQH
ncbi:hypothetical protein Tco_0212635 [Tanacetum coccineum]